MIPDFTFCQPDISQKCELYHCMTKYTYPCHINLNTCILETEIFECNFQIIISLLLCLYVKQRSLHACSHAYTKYIPFFIISKSTIWFYISFVILICIFMPENVPLADERTSKIDSSLFCSTNHRISPYKPPAILNLCCFGIQLLPCNTSVLQFFTLTLFSFSFFT